MSAFAHNIFQFAKPIRPIDRVFIHCSASDYPQHDNISTIRDWHLERGWSDVGYHYFIRKDGTIELGRSLEKTPAAQRGHNRGTVAICLHGLDPNKFTTAQKATLRALCFQINFALGGVSFHGHCEVAAKACPVIDYQSVLKLTSAGILGVDKPLTAIQHPAKDQISQLEESEANNFSGLRLLKFGARGEDVKRLQEKLVSLNYHVGKVDGKFGGLTRTAVMAFQADNYLLEDGKVGSATYEALEEATPRPLETKRQKAGLLSLAKDGSRIAQASVSQAAMGGMIGVGGITNLLEQSSGTVSKITQSLGTYGNALKSLGPWLGALVVLAGVLIVLQSIKAGRARVADHRSGKTA